MRSLYLHIPFCNQKCPYCDFFSQIGSADQIDVYVDLLLSNLDILKQRSGTEQPLDTIYFGGGTPSLLSAGHLARILERVDNNFGFSTDGEITLEVNPGTVNLEQLKRFRSTGINRLSIGIQSLDDLYLKRLGRIHNSMEARQCVANARQAGFDNLSVDLIFALPEQTQAHLESELHALIDLQAEHISIYGLSYEEGTEFERLRQKGVLKVCDEELYADQYRLISSTLGQAAYEHYEISNFARKDQRCRHNSGYWERHTCLAAGCGAHGFDARNFGTRWHIPPVLEQYRKAIQAGQNPAEELERFSKEEAMREYFYLALRTSDGVDRERFKALFNCDAEQVFANEMRQINTFLHSDERGWHFDPKGWLIYDHLISTFL